MSLKSFITLSTVLLVTACQNPTGENFMANVYKPDQLNQKQEAKTVQILAVTAAKVEVDNSENKRTAQLAGGLLGGIGGAVLGNNISNKYEKEGTVLGGLAGAGGGAIAGNALVKDKVLVDGVTITYIENNKTLSSTQVGKACEFAPGKPALIVSMSNKETRIQPNSTCPIASNE